MADVPSIEVSNARTHNLKGVSCDIPHRRVTVVTGPSGAGKSSLAFDTVFAEGQRRFVESMSTYARQFLVQMERPPVDDLKNILPAVALEAKNSITNARSTVGTITEIHDVLRLLYAHIGVIWCPNGHGEVRGWTPEEVALELERREGDEPLLVVARVPRPKGAKGGKAAQATADRALDELIRQGFARRLPDGFTPGEPLPRPERMEPGESWPAALDPLPLVLGRFKPSTGARLTAALEEAYDLTGGGAEVLTGDGVSYFARGPICTVCGETLRRPTPALFSFNSPLGACDTCQGFGRVTGIDPDRVVPDPRRSLRERPIAPWNTPAYEDHYDDLYRVAEKRGLDLDTPWRDLSEDDRRFVWRGAHGGGSRKEGFVTLDKFFQWLERRTYRVHVRVLLARYRAYHRCPDCGGDRLQPEGRAVTVHGETLPALTALSVEKLYAWLAERPWTDREREVSGELLDEVVERVGVLRQVGLDYLTLGRQARTLSGGESQRIHLAAALGGGLTSTLYVLDEPTVGLHPQDSDRLVELLRDLAAKGNTVLVVEHDRTVIEGADHVIDLGPAAGEHGGEIIAQGTLEELLEHPASLTGQYLRQRPPTAAREHLARFRREHRIRTPAALAELPRLVIRNAHAHNLKGFDVEIPLGAMVAVTGVSGSGKSTLVENVLYGTYQRSQGVADVDTGECDALEGFEAVTDVVMVDQRPLGRSSRSNPVTYVKAYDEIRKVFAGTKIAKQRGITPGHFSFNVDKGRCPECKGTGVIEVDMQFMAPVTVTCDRCQGRRFERDVLGVTFRNRSIDEVLELTVDEAYQFFDGFKRLQRRLEVLRDVGLGYLRLGQSTSTLSGGEAQRLKLASFLDRPKTDGQRLFLFDEPTTGLHLSDIDMLYRTLRRLVERGDGVLVVEHSTDLIARCDWILDLGPGGGIHGGELCFSGPLDRFLDEGEGPTARELRRHLHWEKEAA